MYVAAIGRVEEIVWLPYHAGLSGSGDTLWESIREWLLVPPFTRAFLKSPSSRGLSAVAELLVFSTLSSATTCTAVFFLFNCWATRTVMRVSHLSVFVRLHLTCHCVRSNTHIAVCVTRSMCGRCELRLTRIQLLICHSSMPLSVVHVFKRNSCWDLGRHDYYQGP